jgi:phage tail tube protein FII
MPTNTLYILESANIICGDTGAASQPGFSTHLMLQEMKLPGMQENNMDHAPGGARIAIEVPSHIQKLEATFNLAGWQPDIMQLLGTSIRSQQRYTIYGLIRDRRTGNALQARAFIEGRMGKVNPTNYKKGDLMAHEYAINSIIHYELYMQSTPVASAAGTDTALAEIYYWDFFESTFRVGGVDIQSEQNMILAIPGAAI